jgi:hypothetical protein
MSKFHRPTRTAGRIVSVLVIVFMLGFTANAYTVVMRGGRRIEIPSRFVLTASTLTYEAAPGVQITLQVAAIDIPATERANNEQAGSLLRRAQLAPQGSSGPLQASGVQNAPATPTRRTITNRDLESTTRRRLESESAYENRRKQLGLPSVAESRAQTAGESDSLEMVLNQRRAAERESENYWRARAESLRTEIAALDAELAYVRARLDEGPFATWNGWSGGSFTTITSVVPFISFGGFGGRSFGHFGGASFPGPRIHRPGVFVAPQGGSQLTGRAAFGRGATRGQVLLNPGSFPARPFGNTGRFPVFPGGAVFGTAIPAYDYSYERSALITHFNELAAARAGLRARWRELEDEARRAGAPPGWLRR